MRDEWRVGKRVGQDRWQVKQAPGWRVAHECDTLQQAACWLAAQGADVATVAVLSAPPGRTLGELVDVSGLYVECCGKKHGIVQVSDAGPLQYGAECWVCGLRIAGESRGELVAAFANKALTSADEGGVS